eukprot:13930359-Alexandrium_andersonii.AAC.1
MPMALRSDLQIPPDEASTELTLRNPASEGVSIGSDERSRPTVNPRSLLPENWLTGPRNSPGHPGDRSEELVCIGDSTSERCDKLLTSSGQFGYGPQRNGRSGSSGAQCHRDAAP